jgi:hypothetical protein
MTTRRDLCKLIAATSVLAVAPGITSAIVGASTDVPPELWKEPYSFTGMPRFVRSQVLGPNDLFLPSSEVVQVRRFEILGLQGEVMADRLPGLSASVEDGRSVDAVAYAAVTVPAEAPYGVYNCRWHLEIRGAAHVLDRRFLVVEDDVSRYGAWYAPDVGKFVIASSAEDAALRYHRHIGWQGTVPQGFGLRSEDWELWPADLAIEFAEKQVRSSVQDIAWRVKVWFPDQWKKVGPGYFGSTDPSFYWFGKV